MSSSFNRRHFLGAAGASVAAGAIAKATWASPSAPAPAPSAPVAGKPSSIATGTLTKDKLGVQLFGCLAPWLADGPATLAMISEIGYSYVEFALGYGSVTSSDLTTSRIGMSAKSFRKALDDNGLWCNAGHGPAAYPYDDKAWKTWVEDNLVIGTKNLGTNSAFPTTKSELGHYIEAVHKAHEVARKMGYKGAQFNHLESWVKVEGTSLHSWEYVAQRTAPTVWNMEWDGLAYAELGSIRRCIDYIRKYPGRWSLFHFKDVMPNVFLPTGEHAGGQVPAEFGFGVFGLPDIDDPKNRPHAGFQDLLTAIRETQNWKDVLIIAEGEVPTSLAACADYQLLAYRGLNGLQFPYHPRRR